MAGKTYVPALKGNGKSKVPKNVKPQNVAKNA
jgi:hypothetical protein